MKNRLEDKINKILDEWDPIGVNYYAELDISQNETMNEYRQYVPEIIKVFFSGCSVFDYLINLYASLIDEPKEEGIRDTKIATQQIEDLLGG